MLIYKGCKGEKDRFGDGTVWMLTFEDGTHDMATTLKMAIMLCNKELRRARL